MSTSSITTTASATMTATEREALVAEAIHSGEMEGLHVDPVTREDAQEYITGQIS